MSYLESLLNTYHAFSNLFDVTVSVANYGNFSADLNDFKFYTNSVSFEGYQVSYDFHSEHLIHELKSISVPKKLSIEIKERYDYIFFNFLKKFFKENYYDKDENFIKKGVDNKLLDLTITFFSSTNNEKKIKVSSKFFISGLPALKGSYGQASVITYMLDLFAPNGYDITVDNGK